MDGEQPLNEWRKWDKLVLTVEVSAVRLRHGYSAAQCAEVLTHEMKYLITSSSMITVAPAGYLFKALISLAVPGSMHLLFPQLCWPGLSCLSLPVVICMYNCASAMKS